MLLRGQDDSGVDRCILVDTGVGTKWSQKHADRYAIELDKQRLEPALAERGVALEDVTDVILTHLHFDHAGGVTTRTEQGEIRPTFPNAQHYLQRANLENARDPNGRERASYLEENFTAIEASGRLTLLDGDSTLFPGVEVRVSDGHTTGQQIVCVHGVSTDPFQGIVYCADLIPTSTHVPVPWHMGYDVRPLVVMDEKEQLLREATQKNWLLFYEHDPDWAATSVEVGPRGFLAGSPVNL